MSDGNIGISFAVPVNLAMNVGESIIRTGRWERPWIGILMRETETGVRVVDVVNDSPASRGGLKVGDTILRVDGKPVRSTSEVQKTIFKRKIGDPAAVEIDREGRTLQLELVTETMPAPTLMLRE